mgnify:CR=1 FL=1|jgi:hypothetical protein
MMSAVELASLVLEHLEILRMVCGDASEFGDPLVNRLHHGVTAAFAFVGAPCAIVVAMDEELS